MIGKLVLDVLVPDKYDKQTVTRIVREITTQLNSLSEGKITARYQAQSVVPGSSVAAQVGDVVWDSNPTVRSGTVSGSVGNYIRDGWICIASDPVSPVWRERRIGTDV